mmetsp:Transcript_18302/g.34032  ORF Transcript_18302/g.34032 Transcript_18302/m.34032 type:complete len:141 (+) Transcript_18302:242-664(+)
MSSMPRRKLALPSKTLPLTPPDPSSSSSAASSWARVRPRANRCRDPWEYSRTGSDVVSTNDLRAVVGFAAAISIDLAVINSLPLPALDGGQLVFVLAEAATGRKIDQRLQENINAAVLLLLLLVSVGTTIGDVEAIALGR